MLNYTTISLPDATYECFEILTANSLNDSLRTPLQEVIQNLNAIGKYIEDNEQDWKNDSGGGSGGTSLNQPLIGINTLNSSPNNNSILFYDNSWGFKTISSSLKNLLSIEGLPQNNQILQYYDNSWRYVDLPSSETVLSGLLKNLQNDGVDSSNKNGQNKILVYNNGIWSYREYASQGEDIDLSEYTWWGQSISGNKIEGNLSGNIKFIEFNDTINNRTIYLGLDNDGNLRVSSSSGVVNFYATGGVSALGSGSGGGSSSGGASLDDVWNSLGSSTDNYSSRKINIAHIPTLPYLSNIKNNAIFQLPDKASGKTYTLVTTEDLSNISFTLSPATNNLLGGVKVGSGLTITNDGILSISNNIATQSWVNQQGFVKSSGVTSVGMSVPTGFTVNDSPVTTSGTLVLGIANGYSLPTTAKQSQWDTAYSERHIHSNKSVLDGITQTKVDKWDNDYVTLATSQTISGTKTFSTGPILNNATPIRVRDTDGTVRSAFELDQNNIFAIGYGVRNLTNSSTHLYGNSYIRFNLNGSVFTKVTPNGFVIGNDGNETTDTTHYLQIGGGKLCWDNANKALYVQQADGTAAHFYATGGVSALGMGVSGTASLNTLTLGSLSVTGNTTLKTLAVNTKLTLPSEIVASGSPMIVRQSGNADCIYPFFGHAQATTSGYDYYYNQYDNVGLKGTNYNYDDSWSIDPDGNADFKKISCGTTHIIQNYIYINSQCRLFASGSTVQLQTRSSTTTTNWITKGTW